LRESNERGRRGIEGKGEGGRERELVSFAFEVK